MSRPSLTWFKVAVAVGTVIIGAVLSWGMARNDPWTWFHIIANGPEAARALPVILPSQYQALEARLDDLVATRPLSCTDLPLVDLELVEQFAVATWGSDPWLSFLVVVDRPEGLATTMASFIDPPCHWRGGSFERLDFAEGWPGPAIGYFFSDPDQGRVAGTIAAATHGDLMVVVQHEALAIRPSPAQTRELLEIALERARRPFRAWIVPAFFGGFLAIGAGALWFPRSVLALWVANAALFVVRSPFILAPVALIAFAVFAARAYRQVARRASLERADPDSAPDSTLIQMGEQLEGMGFLPVGMVRFQLGRATSLWPILLNQDRNGFVVCNDRFVTVCSRFGPRMLVTIGSGHAPVSPTVLRTSVPGGTVAEMVDAHHRSLEHLASLGYQPDELDEFPLIDEYIEREARELAWASSLSWLMGLRALANVTLRIHMDAQPLDQSATSLERIHRWWESGSLSHSPPTTDYIA